MKKTIKILLAAVVTASFFTACQKEGSLDLIPPSSKDSAVQSSQGSGGSGSGGGGASTTLSYGDTIFYLHTGAPNIISPKNFNRVGTFYGFPKGIELDSTTGTIDLANSETGLRYKILFVPRGTTDTIRTKIVISGINFYDGIYHLSQGDTIANAIYNANGQPFAPGQFGCGFANVFDDGNGCNSQGCAVSLFNGKINLAKSLRDGALPRVNDAQKQFTYYYRMDDPSSKALNSLKVKLYFYNTLADIPQYLWDILLIDHAGTILTRANNGGGTMEVAAQGAQGVAAACARPRPPCLIIIMN
jgi:predicted small lipoprotein YifL